MNCVVGFGLAFPDSRWDYNGHHDSTLSIQSLRPFMSFSPFRLLFCSLFLLWFVTFGAMVDAQERPADTLRQFQFRAAELEKSDWIHWGNAPGKFSNWTNHSNRLIPVYTYGICLLYTSDAADE